jgi:hypothetical protein
MCLCRVSLEGGLTAPAFQLLPTLGNALPLVLEIGWRRAYGRRLAHCMAAAGLSAYRSPRLYKSFVAQVEPASVAIE